MSGKKTDRRNNAQPSRGDRRLKIAVIAFAIIEFIGIVTVIYYKTVR